MLSFAERCILLLSGLHAEPPVGLKGFVKREYSFIEVNMIGWPRVVGDRISAVVGFLLLLSAAPARAVDLTVAPGETLVLAAGEHEYQNITVEYQGVLKLTGQTKLNCYRLHLRGGAMTYSGATRIVVGYGLTNPASPEYAMLMENGAQIYPDYGGQEPGDDGRDGYDLSVFVYGHLVLRHDNKRLAVGSWLSARGQDGADGENGLLNINIYHLSAS